MGVTLRCGLFAGGDRPRAGQTGGNFAGRQGPKAIGPYRILFLASVSQGSDIGQRHLSKTKYP
jgi:hypothetical protein